jgi:hypothetical protein
MEHLAHLAARHGLEVVVDPRRLTIVRQGQWEPLLQFNFEFKDDTALIGELPATVGRPSPVLGRNSFDFNELGELLTWLDERMMELEAGKGVE